MVKLLLKKACSTGAGAHGVGRQENSKPPWQETYMSTKTHQPIRIDVNQRGRSPDRVE